jgi:23S rRNA A2030 N6-methylase RlmJ
MDLHSKEFKKLRDKWYKRLKDSGFVDIENKNGELLTSHADYFRYRQKMLGSTTFEVKEEYYRLARQFLSDHKFADKREMLIWEYHSEGKSIREIVRRLKARGHTAYKDLVSNTVKELSQLMRETNNL